MNRTDKKMKIKKAKPASNGGEAYNQSINLINEGTVINGDIEVAGDLRIDGGLVGNIVAKGRLVVGPNGKVDGEINCSNIEISGYIKGKVVVSEMLSMKSTAKIYGDIVAGKISVEPGSLFLGTCSMGESEVAPEQNGKPLPKE